MDGAMSDTIKSPYLDGLSHTAGARRDIAGWVEAAFAPHAVLHAPCPIDDCANRDAALARFWRPLLSAIPDLERRDDIVMSGRWKDGDWTASLGHWEGTFGRPWLGLAATGGFVSIRFGEFHRFEAGAIVETYLLLDLPDLMAQAGHFPFAPPRGPNPRWPGPATRDGVARNAPNTDESAESLALVEAMIAGLMSYDGKSLESMGMQRFWREGFLWFGPGPIGTGRGLKGFQDVHQRPFLSAFPDRKGGDHKCRIGEGAYVASTGWPSIRATHSGPDFLMWPATGKAITMRVMDFWRREEALLAENWVFIDILDLMRQIGLDPALRAPDAA
jgi:predicted ester cyclase